MSESSSRGTRDQASRVLKSNTFTGRRSGTPDSPNSGQGATSPVPNAGTGSPTSTTSSVTNHHPLPQIQHHSNHRPYAPRGRHRDGGYYGGHNHLGGHHSGSYRRPSPPIPGPPFSKALVDFMLKQWNDFEVNYKKSRGEPLDNGLMPPPAAPTSPRAPNSHINSPHRGQHTRYYYHQNSTGSNWSVNSGGGRRFSDNGDHSNTGSLRRHHGRGGHAASPLPQNNSSWQRNVILGNRQNSPNNTLSRPTGQRHPQHPHRPIASPTPPPVAEAMPKKVNNVVGSPVVEATATQLETLAIKSSEAQQPEVASTSEVAAAAAVTRKKNTESVSGEVRTAEEERCAVSSTCTNDEVSRTSPRAKQQHQQPSSHHHQHQRYIHPPRRRAATTQSSGGGGGLQSGTAAFSLPSSVAGGSATRALETASVASSSFCSLIDQVDAMSSADQYFTPEPPSSPSSASVSLSVGVEGAVPSNTAHFFQAHYASGDNSEATAASPTSAQAVAASSITTDR